MTAILKYSVILFFLFQCSSAQGSVLLVGGGSENYKDWSDIPYGWLVDHAPNKKILILHYSTVSTFLPDYFKSLGAVQAVSTILSSATANDSATYKMILEYDGIFLRGGDQWEYVKQWKGTLAENAINAVFQRGGAIGGTSAGAMILSKIIADAKTTSVDPRTSIRSPLGSGITFTDDFLGFVPGILCDTHFYERGRISRLLSMLAVYHHLNGEWITGVGIDDATALGVLSNGSAEVFGSGVVTFLLPDQKTAAHVNSSKPLGVNGMAIRQFTKGAVVQLPSGTVISSPNMNVFTPIPFSSLQKSISLDGSSSSADWTNAAGSLIHFLPRAGNDTIQILTSAPGNSQLSDIRSFLTSHTVPSSVTIVSPSLRNASDPASLFTSRSSFILVNISPDSLSFLVDSMSLTGTAFRNISGRNFLLLGDAAAYAGTTFVNKLELTTTAAYRGRLTMERGLGLVKGMLILPRLYESDSYIENRASGLPWGIGKAQPSFGIYLDNSSHCIIENQTVTAYGQSPAILFDLRSTSSSAFPVYIASSGIGPRQNAAFNSALLHVVTDSTSRDLGKPSGIEQLSVQTVPLQYELLNIYPNPFNPTASIEFILREKEFVTITISDILGRILRTVAQREFPSGRHSLEFNAASLPSGIYFVSLSLNGRNGIVFTKKALLTK